MAAAIRAAAPDDLERLIELWTALVEHHRSLDPEYPRTPGLRDAFKSEIERGMRDPGCRIWVAESEGATLGFLFAEAETESPAVEEGGIGWIHELYVDPRARRSGVGRALVERALAFFRERRSGRVSVRVETPNVLGREFWESLGFSERALILERRSLP